MPYHRLGGKEIFVPELEVFYVLQEDLFIFPGLEEICATQDGGRACWFISLYVNRGWFVIRLDTPYCKKNKTQKSSIYISLGG